MPVLTIIADASAAPEACETQGGWRVSGTSGPVLSREDREDLRWYFEDYLRFPGEPAPQIARRVEQTLRTAGESLFQSILGGTPEREAIWNAVSKRLTETRIEIRGSAGGSELIPFELMRAPGLEAPLAIAAQALVRVSDKPPRVKFARASLPMRVLLVICRPGGERDVPFRSVGGEIVRGGDLLANGLMTVEVLRPPLARRLERALLASREAGRPYHVVHIDAHGVFADLERRGIPRGYIQFEHSGSSSNAAFANGEALGQWLVAGGVPVAIVNACRSAYAQPRPANVSDDAQPRAFASLAREMADAGVPGVVAMRYNVSVPTAARVVSGLYARLASGLSLGEAVNGSRADLAADPQRRIGMGRYTLDDWSIPIVLEAEALRLCDRARDINVRMPPANTDGGPAREVFVGRDDALLRLDRGFDGTSALLLVGQVGIGKSATAREFGRWYHLTGGCTAVRCASMREGEPDHLLEQLEGDVAAASAARLWILDDVDHVDGYPVRLISAWQGRHRRRLRNWLHRATAAGVKVLLVGRRARQDWCGTPPATVRLRPLPDDEAADLLARIAGAEGAELDGAIDWSMLVGAAAGVPPMLLALYRRIVSEVPHSRGDISPTVEALVAGEAEFAENDPLAAAVGEALRDEVAARPAHALTALHLFRGCTSTGDLQVMGISGVEWQLEELAEVGANPSVADALLKRLEDQGLAGRFTGPWYTVHPALPVALREPFARDYPGERAAHAERAYVCSIGDFANHFTNYLIGGSTAPVHALGFHLPNLLRAWNIGVARGWFDQVVYLMQGIEELLRSQNRLGDFKRFVDTVEPRISMESGPDPRWHLEWRFVQEYKARLAAMDRSLYTAAERDAALAALAAAPSGLEPQEALRTHAVGLNERGLHLLQRGDPAGLEFIEQSLAIARGLDDPQTFHAGLVRLASLLTQLHDVPDYEKVEAMLEEAITAARERRQDRLQLEGLIGLAEALIRKVKMLRWRNVPGLELVLEMNRIAAALGEAKPLVDLSRWPEATARHAMAVAESMLLDRQYEPAMAAFSTAVELFSQDPVRAAQCMTMIGYCCQALDRPEAARDYFKAADGLGKRHGFSLDPLWGEPDDGSSPP